MLNTVLVPEKFFINSLGQICSLSGSWFWICCSFFTIWIFNIYSWIVSAVLFSDGVLSVPATKAFSKSQNLGNFPCKFIFAHFHAVSTEATKAATLWLCFVWHLIPHPVWHMVTQLGDNQTHALPLFPSPKCAFDVQEPWRFPQDCRRWGAWNIFGLLSHLDSTLIYFPGDKCNIFHSVDSGEGVHPSPCSTAPLSACPLWFHTSWAIQGVKRMAICLQVQQQTHKSAQPVLQPTSSPRKGFVISFQMYILWLAVPLESSHKTLQRTQFDFFRYIRTRDLRKIIVKYKVILKYSTEE